MDFISLLSPVFGLLATLFGVGLKLFFSRRQHSEQERLKIVARERRLMRKRSRRASRRVVMLRSIPPAMEPNSFMRFDRVSERKLSAATLILVGFGGLVGLIGIVSLIKYWDAIWSNQDTLLFGVWLFVFMVAGMFVQVLAFNYRAGNPLLSISASQLVFPLLFSVVVFYPVWAIGTSGQGSFFSIHAAFLNGYFWESVVSAAQPPKSKE